MVPHFSTLCTLPLPSDLFAQAIHPTEPLLAIGLSSGHVQTLKLPAVDAESSRVLPEKSSHSSTNGRRGSNGTGVIDTVWKTRRHEGSCRCLGFSLDGASLYSAGTDGLVKAADTETGRVVGKIAIPSPSSSSSSTGDVAVDAPTVLHALSPQTLLLTTDSGALHLYDLRDPAPSVSTATAAGGKQAFISAKPAQTHHPHTDYISSLTPLPPSATSTSGYSKQWLTTGGSTLALTDLRRGVLVKSEDQHEELLSSLYVTGLSTKKSSGSTGEKALVGGSDGTISVWEKGQWDDQNERIMISRDKETIDTLALVPDGENRDYSKCIAVGTGDGTIKFLNMGVKRVQNQVRHDEVEGVVALGFDVGGRMISGGGPVVKVWEDNIDPGEALDSEEEEMMAKYGRLWKTEDEVRLERAGEGDDENSGEVGLKRAVGESDSDDEVGGQEAGEAASSEEEEVQDKKKRKKKKRKRGKASPGKGSDYNFSGLD